jgi:ribose 5-phosphate isomerase B
MNSPLLVASDHAGYIMKKELVDYLRLKGLEIKDLGTDSTQAVDYPEFGHKLGELIGSGRYELGISICGSGNGINMTTNKHKGVRGAICWNEEISEMARKHNDANICSLPARYIDIDMAKRIVDIFLSTRFEGGRHVARINKIDL